MNKNINKKLLKYFIIIFFIIFSLSFSGNVAWADYKINGACSITTWAGDDNIHQLVKKASDKAIDYGKVIGAGQEYGDSNFLIINARIFAIISFLDDDWRTNTVFDYIFVDPEKVVDRLWDVDGVARIKKAYDLGLSKVAINSSQLESKVFDWIINNCPDKTMDIDIGFEPIKDCSLFVEATTEIDSISVDRIFTAKEDIPLKTLDGGKTNYFKRDGVDMSKNNIISKGTSFIVRGGVSPSFTTMIPVCTSSLNGASTFNVGLFTVRNFDINKPFNMFGK